MLDVAPSACRVKHALKALNQIPPNLTNKKGACFSVFLHYLEKAGRQANKHLVNAPAVEKTAIYPIVNKNQ